jgi:LPXTG-site transpeptidase (sortase) family protein
MSSYKNQFLNVLGILLIIAGLGLMGNYAWGKIQVAYYQNQLKDDFEESIPEVPEETEPEGPIQVTFEEWAPMRLSIPKIDIDYMILTGEVMSREFLDKGPVHYEMSDLPSTEGGNVAIAGHRGGKWGFFLRLNELEDGDRIYLYTGGYRFSYTVKDVFLVEPTDWSVIHSTEIPTLTLTTCHPWNAPATHRLIAKAEFQDVIRMVRK